MNIAMRFPGGLDKALTLSYDDGVMSDIKLMSILDKAGIKCTFNINSGLLAADGTAYAPEWPYKYVIKSEAKSVYTAPHEVACHFRTHPMPSFLPLDAQVGEIMLDRAELEEIFGTQVRGCAYPYGDYNADTLQAMRACGMLYGRTVRDTHSFELPADPMQLDPTCHHNDARLFELCEEFLKLKVNPYFAPKMFYLWGHSFEFDTDGNWDRISRFAEMMGGNDDIWYATNGEIFEYTEAFSRLQVFMKGRAVFNPTSTPLFFSADGNTVSVFPGQTVRL